MNRVALSTEDVHFGRIEVLWQGNTVPNLYLATFRIENSSYTDFENLETRIWCGSNVKLLQDNINHEESTFEISYSDEYNDKITFPENSEPSPYQVNFYRSTRDYLIPVFNRGSHVRIQVLCLSEDAEPKVFLDIRKKGVVIRRQFPQQQFWGEPVTVLLPWTILSSIIITAGICSIQNIWIVGFLALFVGLFGQFWGAVIYKTLKKIRNLISF